MLSRVTANFLGFLRRGPLPFSLQIDGSAVGTSFGYVVSKSNMVSPLLAPSGPLRIVHSSIVPNGVKSCRTSSSVCCLLSIPTKSLRSSVKAKSTELMWRPRQRASVGIAREQERVVEKQQVLRTRTRRTYLPPPHRAAPSTPSPENIPLSRALAHMDVHAVG